MEKLPIIKKGDILFSGNSYFAQEHRTFYLVATGNMKDGRSIVPKEAISDMRRLGIELVDHWNYNIEQEGHLASHEVEYRDGSLPVDLHIKAFLSGSLKNSQVTSILEEEY